MAQNNYFKNDDNKIKKISLIISIIICSQFLLGIITLVNMVPVYLGALHQTGAVILLISLVCSMHRLNLITKFN